MIRFKKRHCRCFNVIFHGLVHFGGFGKGIREGGGGGGGEGGGEGGK